MGRVSTVQSWLLGGRASHVTPTKTTALYFNFIHGPARPNDDHDQRSAYEVVGSWKTTAKLNLGFDGLYAHDENGVSLGHDAIWKGMAGYAKYNLTKPFSLAFRGRGLQRRWRHPHRSSADSSGIHVDPRIRHGCEIFRCQPASEEAGRQVRDPRGSSSRPVEQRRVPKMGHSRRSAVHVGDQPDLPVLADFVLGSMPTSITTPQVSHEAQFST